MEAEDQSYLIFENKNNSINITDMNMTRFNITLDQGVKYVLRCLEIMWVGKYLYRRFL